VRRAVSVTKAAMTTPHLPTRSFASWPRVCVVRCVARGCNARVRLLAHELGVLGCVRVCV
jgi:hypothetical protein